MDELPDEIITDTEKDRPIQDRHKGPSIASEMRRRLPRLVKGTNGALRIGRNPALTDAQWTRRRRTVRVTAARTVFLLRKLFDPTGWAEDTIQIHYVPPPDDALYIWRVPR